MRHSTPTWVLTLVMFLSCFSCYQAVIEDDIKCLKGLKQAFDDPLGKLASWDFANSSVGFICHLVGVSCWDYREIRLLNLELRDMSLSGTIPKSIEYCISLQNLDLRGNKLSGTIPIDLCSWLPYLITLDLSDNGFTGPIPVDLGNCTFLSSLILSDNKLSGSIPWELSSSNRLKKFSVANNELSGTVPDAFDSYDKADFAGNDGLCGGPVKKCGGFSKKSLAIIIAAGVFGAAASLLLTCWLLGLSKKQGLKPPR